MTQLMEKGARVEGKSGKIWVENGKKAIIFDRKIRSGNGKLSGIKIVARNERLRRNKTTGSAHHLFGHPGLDVTRETARKYGLRHVFSEEVCESCAITKAAQKGTRKKSTFSVKEVGERIQFDTNSVKKESSGGSKHWQMFVDEATGFKKSYTGAAKSSLYENGMAYVRHLKKENIGAKRFRCDDASENKKFEKIMEKAGFLSKFEYTGRSTPQHNGMVERAFATITSRVRAMMKEAGIEGKMKTKLWAECVRTATILDGFLVEKSKDNCKYELFYGRKSELIPHLRSFGEIGIVFDYKGKKMRKKMEDRGFAAIFVGYAPDHAGDVYRMYNPVTNRVIVTRDVKFLGKYYRDWKKGKNKTMNSYLENVDEVLDIRAEDTKNPTDTSSENFNDRSGDLATDMDVDTTDEVNISDRSGIRTRSMGGSVERNDQPEVGTQLYREMRKINDTWNPTLGDVVEFALVGGTDDLYENPRTFQEAWNRPDAVDREKWREAIRKEFNDMIYKRKVWRHCKKSTIPKDRRLIDCKWVFKKKKNQVYRARLCAIGYSQIPGVDHEYNFAPVVTETTFRIVLVMALLNQWKMEIVDVETAFLYGDLEEEIYMKLPEGLDLFLEKKFDSDEALILVQAMYGLVQAARQFFKKLRDTMVKEMGFAKCLSDQCLLVRESKIGTLVVCIYIDDTLVIGDVEAVREFKLELKEHFSTKEEGEMTEYVGCMVGKNDDGILLHQSDLIKKIEKKFDFEAKKMRNYRIPASAGQGLVKSTEEEGCLSAEKQTEYRSGVGMLLFLTKFSRPDISNTVRELSKMNTCANEAHMKELLRLVKFVLDTRFWMLKYKVNGNLKKKLKWLIRALCDSDFAGDKDTRLSVTGYGVYVMDCLVSWKSRAMRTHALSSTEAEYIALSELCCEILFIRQVLEFLGVEVDYPIVVNCDNIGAIFLAHNAKVSSRTKHIDLKTHFVREYIEEGIIKVVFVRSEENDSDIWTKNTSEAVFTKHTDKFMEKKET